MIRVYDDLNEYSNEEYKTIFESFPDALKSKVKGRVGEDRKKICIAEYFSLQQLLACADLNMLKFSENGKPYIDNEKFFNISNSADVFCIAISDNEVGVDIQKTIPYNEKLAKRICNQKELTLLEKSDDKDVMLTKLWTKKESLIKCKGETIAQDLKSLLEDTSGFKFRHFRYKDFVVCECIKVL